MANTFKLDLDLVNRMLIQEGTQRKKVIFRSPSPMQRLEDNPGHKRGGQRHQKILESWHRDNMAIQETRNSTLRKRPLAKSVPASSKEQQEPPNLSTTQAISVRLAELKRLKASGQSSKNTLNSAEPSLLKSRKILRRSPRIADPERRLITRKQRAGKT